MRRSYLIYQQWFRAAEATGAQTHEESVAITADATLAAAADVTFEAVAADIVANATMVAAEEHISSTIDWQTQMSEPVRRIPGRNFGGFFSEITTTPTIHLESATMDADSTLAAAADVTIAGSAADMVADATMAAAEDHISTVIEWQTQMSEPLVKRLPRQNLGGITLPPSAEAASAFDEIATMDADATLAAAADVTFEAAGSMVADATMAAVEEHISAQLDWYTQYHNPSLRTPQRNHGGAFNPEEEPSAFDGVASMVADATLDATADVTFEGVAADMAADATMTAIGDVVSSLIDWQTQMSEPVRRIPGRNFGGLFDGAITDVFVSPIVLGGLAAEISAEARLSGIAESAPHISGETSALSRIGGKLDTGDI